MGLREQNAARARAAMVQAALKLFLDVGYEATTMEEIAQAADVGSSTLYRYFDCKEALVMAPLGQPGLMAASVRSASSPQLLADAVGEAVIAMLVLPRREVLADQRYHALITTHPRVQSRLLQWYQEEEHLLCEAIAAREGASAADVGVRITARAAMLILEVATQDLPTGTDRHRVAERARAVMKELHDRTIVLPYSSENC